MTHYTSASEFDAGAACEKRRMVTNKGRYSKVYRIKIGPRCLKGKSRSWESWFQAKERRLPWPVVQG